jgi:hypothetical protein
MTTDALPEPLATIARMRLDGRPEPEIAARLGMPRQKVWERIARWNAQHPHLRIPQPYDRTKATKTATVLALHREGLSNAAIAERIGASKGSVSRIVSMARARGAAAPREIVDADGQARWQRYARKGIVRQQGTLGDVLRALTPQHVDMLLDMKQPHERTLSATLGRVIKEHLNAAQ